jgi:hypothetical protein
MKVTSKKYAFKKHFADPFMLNTLVQETTMHTRPPRVQIPEMTSAISC